jgi:hypothetical protein
MQGGKGVEALDVSALAHTGDPATITVAVLFVYLLYHSITDHLLDFSDAAGSLDPGDGFVQVRAGEPEPGRHVSGRLVLDDARKSERAPGCDPEALRLAS